MNEELIEAVERFITDVDRGVGGLPALRKALAAVKQTPEQERPLPATMHPLIHAPTPEQGERWHVLVCPEHGQVYAGWCYQCRDAGLDHKRVVTIPVIPAPDPQGERCDAVQFPGGGAPERGCQLPRGHAEPHDFRLASDCSGERVNVSLEAQYREALERIVSEVTPHFDDATRQLRDIARRALDSEAPAGGSE